LFTLSELLSGAMEVIVTLGTRTHDVPWAEFTLAIKNTEGVKFVPWR